MAIESEAFMRSFGEENVEVRRVILSRDDSRMLAHLDLHSDSREGDAAAPGCLGERIQRN
jgi:hypothetical protein